MAYTSISVEGGLFPIELLDQVGRGDSNVLGQRPEDFNLKPTSRISDETQSAFSAARDYWKAFQSRLEHSKESRTTITREDWVLKFLELLDFNLVFQNSSLETGGEKYAISHRAGNFLEAIPVHIAAIDQSLDHRDGGRRSPHAMVQEYLNRSDMLWGIVTNGSKLRLLRNVVRISKPTYLEFDLEGMVSGNLYSEFVLLYRLLHSTRFPTVGADQHKCLIEEYYQKGIDAGGRVREKLRDGVKKALEYLGTGFLSHPQSNLLKEKFSNHAITESGYYRQLLRLVYRFLFLSAAEERHLLSPQNTLSPEKYNVYRHYYSISQLRDRAERYFRNDTNSDAWLGLIKTFDILRDENMAAQLGLAALNGELFSRSNCQALENSFCSNELLLSAIRELSTFLDDGNVRRRVNYAGLDVEEFGSVYESLLDYHPCINTDNWTFSLVAGSERKQTGSYYTPPELVKELIESALVPVITDRLKGLKTKDDKEKALLGLRVCDPAAGSGHFLLAAARRIARDLATVRSDEAEPTPTIYHNALRDVVRSCIYAVDKNQLAVDLCKVALWMEGHCAGYPLGFLDHHIKHGDSLVGVFDLKVLKEGIPDGAYEPVTGDTKDAARAYKKRNIAEKANRFQLGLGDATGNVDAVDILSRDFQTLATLEEKNPDDVTAKEQIYEQLRHAPTWEKMKNACDLWTAAFFMPLEAVNAFNMEGVPTTQTIRQLLLTNMVNGQMIGQAIALSHDHPFFHWQLEFPDVFKQGGFDVVLGNPPWDRIKMQEKEWFGKQQLEIAGASNAATRRRMVKKLQDEDPALFRAFCEAKRQSDSNGKFARESGFFAYSAVGDLNTYPLFSELFYSLLTPGGYAGLVCPTGLIAEENNSSIFSKFVKNGGLVDIKDFVNSLGIFPAVDRNQRFSLITLNHGSPREDGFNVRFKMLSFEQVVHTPTIQITVSDLALFSPLTKTCPLFDSDIDYRIAKNIYQKYGTWINNDFDNGNPWDAAFLRMFDMTNDAQLFLTKPDNSEKTENILVPLYEAKMINSFDHRFASSGAPKAGQKIRGSSVSSSLPEYEDPYFYVQSRYYVTLSEVLSRKMKSVRNWSLGIRAIAGAVANVRTLVASVLPSCGAGNSILMVECPDNESPISYACLLGLLNSYLCDYFLRQKLCGTNVNQFILKQLPILKPDIFNGICPWKQDASIGHFISQRVIELSYTAWDLEAFAQDCSYVSPPFHWDIERRFLLRSETDAAYFHLYGITRADADHILDSFPIVKRKEEDEYKEYRTKRVILEIYDEMALAIQKGQSYQTRLDPPPGDPRTAHQT